MAGSPVVWGLALMCYRKHRGVSLSPKQVQQLQNNAWLSEHAVRIYKHKINLVAALNLDLNRVLKSVAVKNFGWRNLQSLLFSPLMRSRAFKSWDASLLLTNLGVRVPEPIAVYTERQCGFIQANFLLTENLANALSIRQIFKDENVPFKRKEAIVRRIAEMITRMHRARVVHNDLTRGNFLIRDGDPQQIYLIDLNRIVRRWWLGKRRRLSEIARMNLCPCQLQKEHPNCLWEVFLRHYQIESCDKNRPALAAAIKRNELRRQLKKMRKNR
jgi:tRNA A-37 threonylcarbamoyl transferase component Bud32